jgi:hypothetical protein
MSGNISNKWTIRLAENPLSGLGIHGIIEIVDPSGSVTLSFQGLATKSDGSIRAIGFEVLGDTIKSYFSPGSHPLAAGTDVTRYDLFSGTQTEVETRVSALFSANNAINITNTPYEFPGIHSLFFDITNSNSVIKTYLDVMGLTYPERAHSLTFAGRVGQNGEILSPQIEQTIRDQHQIPAPPRPSPDCFLAGTPVSMAGGVNLCIEDVSVGDNVISFGIGEEYENLKQYRPVVNTFRNTSDLIIDIRGLKTTAGHYFLTENGEFSKIFDILNRDGTITDRDGNMIRARTGAIVNSTDDRTITVFTKYCGGIEEYVVRLGIPCATHFFEGVYKTISLNDLLHSNGLSWFEGEIKDQAGKIFSSVEWPVAGTPLDTEAQKLWVVKKNKDTISLSSIFKVILDFSKKEA